MADAKAKYADAASAESTAQEKEQEYATFDPSGVVRSVEGVRSVLSTNIDRAIKQVQFAIDNGEFNKDSNKKLAEFQAAMAAWKANMPELDGEGL